MYVNAVPVLLTVTLLPVLADPLQSRKAAAAEPAGVTAPSPVTNALYIAAPATVLLLICILSFVCRRKPPPSPPQQLTPYTLEAHGLWSLGKDATPGQESISILTGLDDDDGVLKFNSEGVAYLDPPRKLSDPRKQSDADNIDVGDDAAP